MSGHSQEISLFPGRQGGSKNGKEGKNGKYFKHFCLFCPLCFFFASLDPPPIQRLFHHHPRRALAAGTCSQNFLISPRGSFSMRVSVSKTIVARVSGL